MNTVYVDRKLLARIRKKRTIQFLPCECICWKYIKITLLAHITHTPNITLRIFYAHRTHIYSLTHDIIAQTHTYKKVYNDNKKKGEIKKLNVYFFIFFTCLPLKALSLYGFENGVDKSWGISGLRIRNTTNISFPKHTQRYGRLIETMSLGDFT